MKEEIPLIFYYYWDSYDLQYWIKEGCIPAELLEPSRVLDLDQYLYTNRSELFKKLMQRSKKSNDR